MTEVDDTPAPAADDSARRNGLVVLIAVAAVVMAVATVGPWMTLTNDETGESTSIAGLSHTFAAWAPLVCGLLGLVAAVCMIAGWTVPAFGASPMVAGAWALGWNVYDIVDVEHRARLVHAQFPTVSTTVGYGLVISTAAAVVMLGAAFQQWGGVKHVVEYGRLFGHKYAPQPRTE